MSECTEGEGGGGGGVGHSPILTCFVNINMKRL